MDDRAVTSEVSDRRTLYVGGRVLGPGLEPMGAALLVDAGRVPWVGSDHDSRAYRDAATEVVNLDGGVVTAAFVDAHVHLSATGAALRGVDLSDARSLHEALSRVETAVRRTGGRPLLVQNWDETDWPEQRAFTGRELDRASYGGAVYAPRVDGHSAVVSSALAAAAGLDPWGLTDGRVVTDDHHRARAAFEATLTGRQRQDDIALALRTAAARGFAEVHENGGPVVSSAADFADVHAVAEAQAGPRVVGLWSELVDTPEQAAAVMRAHPGATGLAGDLNVDGSIGSRTARLRDEYQDAPGERGQAFLSLEQVRDHVVACTRASVRAGFHVIGDAGVDTALAGFEAAADVVGLEDLCRRRHRLEHVEMTDTDGARRLARLGVVVSMQPAFDARWGGETGMYAARLGVVRAHRMNPFRTLLDAGVDVVLGSDSPVTPMDPWEAVRACTRHHDAPERITASEAFDAHTRPLGEGGRADLAVWDDPGGWFGAEGSLDESALGPPPTARVTLVDGRVVYRG